jgi:ankyrin repeat protein
MDAVRNQDLVALSKLIESHAALDEPVFPNQYPILVATNAKQNDIVEMLIQAGVSPKTIREGDGPLEAAANVEDVRMVKLLLDRGATPKRLGSGASALAIAARQGNIEIAEVLIKAGADLNDQDSQGFTPLIEAIKKGDLAFVKFLIGRGANPNLPCCEGLPIQVAQDRWATRNPDVAKYLETVADPVPPNYYNTFNQAFYFKEHPERRPLGQ